jgi:4-amino-4-deoxy-L-arabinose transferase-like glycosyltransferase
MNHTTTHRDRLHRIAPILLILVIAAFFRLWRIGSTPPGLFGDEAVNGLDALDVLAGRGQVFFPANYGREGLHMFIIAAFFRLLDVTPLAIRLPSVLAGILTALATYWLGRELFTFADENLKPTVPLLAALWLATAYWHVHFSRFGIRGVFTPLCGALAFAAFWRGVNKEGNRKGSPPFGEG